MIRIAFVILILKFFYFPVSCSTVNALMKKSIYLAKVSVKKTMSSRQFKKVK